MSGIRTVRCVALALLVALGCGDDGGTPGDASTDSTAGDSTVDSTIGDSTVGDSTAGDSAIVDSAVGDSAVADSATGDSTAGDGGTGCGDGVLDFAAGEECDDGNTATGDGCDDSCQLEPVGATCGDGTMDPGEVCDDGNTMNGDGCNPTCNLTNTTSLFVGIPGAPGNMDGIGTAARIRGNGTIAVDATHLWYAQGPGMGGSPPPALRRIEIATANVETVAPIMVAEGCATNGTDTVWVAGGDTIQAIENAPPYGVTEVHTGISATDAASFVDGLPGTASFHDVRGLTWSGGLLWIVDSNAAVIRSMDPATGEVTTVAGMPYSRGAVDGVGSAARFTSPRYIVSDGSGMLYISDTNGQQIRALDTSTMEVTTFAGINGMAGHVDGIGTSARIHRPRGITADASSIYFVEFNAHTVRQGVMATQSVTTLAGMADTSSGSTGGYAEGTGLAAEFSFPFDIAYHFPSSVLFVVDGRNSVIRRIR